jgi:hypothetical protein
MTIEFTAPRAKQSLISAESRAAFASCMNEIERYAMLDDLVAWGQALQTMRMQNSERGIL